MFWADLLPVCLPALSRGNFSDFRGSEKENALSQRSGGVRSSSWTLFCTKFYLEVGRKWNKPRSGMIDSIFEWLTIFFFIWNRQVSHLKKCSDLSPIIANITTWLAEWSSDTYMFKFLLSLWMIGVRVCGESAESLHRMTSECSDSDVRLCGKVFSS